MSSIGLKSLKWVSSNSEVGGLVLIGLGLVLSMSWMEGVSAGISVLVYLASIVFMIVSLLVSAKYLDWRVIRKDEPGSFVDKLSKDDETYYILSNNISWFEYSMFKIFPFAAIGISTAAFVWGMSITSGGDLSVSLFSLVSSFYIFLHFISAIAVIGLFGKVLENDARLLEIYGEWNNDKNISRVSRLSNEYYKIMAGLAVIVFLLSFTIYNNTWSILFFVLSSIIISVAIVLGGVISITHLNRNVVTCSEEEPEKYVDKVEKEDSDFYILSENMNWSKYILSKMFTIIIIGISAASVYLALSYLPEIKLENMMVVIIFGLIPFIMMGAVLICWGRSFKDDARLIEVYEEWSEG